MILFARRPLYGFLISRWVSWMNRMLSKVAARDRAQLVMLVVYVMGLVEPVDAL